MKTMVTKTCSVCKSLFTVEKAKITFNQKIGVTISCCSRECRDKKRIKPRIKTSCYTCGKTLSLYPSYYRLRVYCDNDYGFYCSRECFAINTRYTEEGKRLRNKLKQQNYRKKNPDYSKMMMRKKYASQYGEYAECKMLLFELRDALK